MAAVTLVLPLMLEPITGTTSMRLDGATVAEVLEAAFARVPVLRHHVTDDSGELRGHILCLHNGVSLERGAVLPTPVAAGDELTLVQAISGG